MGPERRLRCKRSKLGPAFAKGLALRTRAARSSEADPGGRPEPDAHIVQGAPTNPRIAFTGGAGRRAAERDRGQ